MSADNLLNRLNAPAAQKPQTLPAMLKQHAARFKAIAPTGVDISRFSAALMAEVRANPKLAECAPLSVLASFVKSTHSLDLNLARRWGSAILCRTRGNARCRLVIAG